MSASAAELRLPALCLSLLLGLVACSEPAGEVLARVNRETVRAQQLELLLKRQPPLPPAQQAAARQALLERLIEQELLVQQAEALQLDREPGLQLQLDAARRDVLARALVERIGAQVAAPSAQQVADDYRANPLYFAERRVYRLQELLVEAEPGELPALREQLQRAPSLAAFSAQLKAQGRRFALHQAARGPEQMAASTLAALRKLRDGELAAFDSPGGLQLLQLDGSEAQPLSEAQARPLIEQRLLAKARGEAEQQELKRLREAARIEIVATPPASAAS